MNNRIFKGHSSTVVDLITSITQKIANWALVLKEFSSFNSNDIFLNWVACMRCGPVRVRKVVHWSPPPLGAFKFNVNGAARALRIGFWLTREGFLISSTQ